MKSQIDELGAEILELPTGHQVMMEWEKPYMKALVDKLSPAGDVLEVGFGLGYSANYIAGYPITSYTVIESDPEIVKTALAWAVKQPFSVQIVEGPWQETLKDLGKFDSIFFDDFSHGDYYDPLDTRIYYFYYQLLRSHVNLNARMVWYCDNQIYWLSYPGTSWQSTSMYISVPENCSYKKSGNMYLPLVTFLEGSDTFAPLIVLDKYFNFRKGSL
jgi:hypothetical protein